MGPNRVVLLFLAAITLAAQPVAAARAQSVTPSPLPGPDAEPLGIRAGGLIMFPSVESGVEITDNVTRAVQDPRSDVGYFVAPAMRIESEWVRHSMRLDASSRHVYYFDNPSEDELDVNVRGTARIDVRRSTSVELEGGYALDQEGRGDIDVPGAAAEPPNEHTLDGSVTLTHKFSRLTVSAEGRIERQSFDDVDLIGGGTQNNSDRNFTEYEGSLRLGYDLSPRLQPFVRASYALRRHDEKVDDNGLRQDSDGFGVSAGVAFELTPLLVGELALGYVRREFEDPALQEIGGVTFEGNLTWRPTPITTVAFTAATEVEETGFGTLSGSILRTFGLSVRHELRRKLMVAGSAEYAIEDYTGAALREDTLLLAVGLTYQFNRAVAFRLGYSYEAYDSSAGGAYDESRFTAGVLVQK